MNKNFIESIIALLIGILLIVIDGNSLTDILLLILGFVIIIANLPRFLTSCQNLKYKTVTAISQFIDDLLIILSGIILIIFQGKVSNIIGILILVFILIQIIIDKKQWKEILKSNILLILISLILIIFNLGSIINILLTISGIILIIISIINMLYNFKGHIND